MALKIRRGTNAERITEVFAQGEPVYITDTAELYIGDGITSGGIKVTAMGSGSTQIGAPLGAIIAFPSTIVPTGFAVCDGSTFNEVLYPELFNLLGTNVLPNLLGQFLRGHSEDASVDSGGPRSPLSTQTDSFKTHTHTATTSIITKDVAADAVADDPNTISQASSAGTNDFNTISAGTTITANGGAETRPKNVAVVWAIALVSGAGLTADSDLTVQTRLDNNDSDILALYNLIGSGGGGDGSSSVDSDWVIRQVSGGVTVSGADSDWVISQMGSNTGSFSFSGTLASPTVGQDAYIHDWGTFTGETWDSANLIEINILVKNASGSFGTYYSRKVLHIADATDVGTQYHSSENTAGTPVVQSSNGVVYSSGNGRRYTSIRPDTTESLNWFIFGKKY